MWGLYGPASQLVILGAGRAASDAQASLSVATLLAALLSGIGGSRVLTSEIDKRILVNQHFRRVLSLLSV